MAEMAQVNIVAGERPASGCIASSRRVDRTMFDVSVDLRIAAASDGALTEHFIEITPKCFSAKLMSPLIRLGLGKQTREAAANLKKLLESTIA